MVKATVSEAARMFLAAVREDVAAATHSLYSLYVGRFVASHGAVALDDVTPAMVRAWGRSYHPVQAVQRLLSWSHHEARLVASNPLEGMRKLPRGRRLRVLTTVELVRLQRLARGSHRVLVLALAETFARPHELRQVQWSDVKTCGLADADDEQVESGQAFFFLDRFKGQRRRRDASAVRVIPISPRLGRMLVRLRRRNDGLHTHLFLNSRGTPWTINAVRCAFRRLRQRAGLGVDHRGENVVAYSLRHTGATAAVVAGVPIADLAGALGHADIRMTQRYVHLSPAFLASVVQRMKNAKMASKRKKRAPTIA